MRLTQLADPEAGKLAADALEQVLSQAGLPASGGALLAGADDGDDAAVVFLDGARAVVSTAGLCGPVVDDAFSWGRIAAAHALSDVWAMGGRPLVALNLLLWPRDRVPLEIAAEVLRGGASACAEAGCLLAGGHSTEDAAARYGLAVTGTVRPDRVLRGDAGVPGLPLTLTKPVGTGVLVERHRFDGLPIDEAVASMTTLNREASDRAVAAGARCATDVSGYGLLGHLRSLCRASRCGAVLEAAAVPVLAGARAAARAGHVPVAAQRNLASVRPHVTTAVDDLDLMLLCDAETSGGLLVVGEVPGHPVVGRLVPDPTSRVTVV